MKYSKKRRVKSPSIGTSGSAGTDFYVPKTTDKFLLDVATLNHNELSTDQLYLDKGEGIIILAPGAHVLIPSGIVCNLRSLEGALYDDKNGIAYIAHNKSSISRTKRLDVGADVVDEDYQGEIHFSLVNTSNRLVKIRSDEKIIQFIAHKIHFTNNLQQVKAEDLFTEETERGDNGFGSTSS